MTLYQNQKIIDILEAYYTPPWQQKRDIKKYLKNESEENVISFIKNMIKPQMEYFIKNKDKYNDYPQREIYIKNVKKTLKEFLDKKPKKKKKFSYKQWMKEITAPKMTDEEYRLKHQEHLRKTLLSGKSEKIESI